MQAAQFLETLWEYYAKHQRQLPWRESAKNGSYSAYRVLVSECMLQQTQVPRVVPKYHAFLTTFPTIADLARAPLADVLRQWQGLGYNRRAKYLHEAAKQLVEIKEPWTLEQLISCKGIGHNTAAAVVAYAYNQPQVFIETNVRTVLIHHFFADAETVSDSQLRTCLEPLVDQEHPREFYYALMDYGTHLKQSAGNAARRSAHYKKQSAFVGSRRELRGKILRLLANGPAKQTAMQAAASDDSRLTEVLTALQSEGLITYQKPWYALAA